MTRRKIGKPISFKKTCAVLLSCAVLGFTTPIWAASLPVKTITRTEKQVTVECPEVSGGSSAADEKINSALSSQVASYVSEASTLGGGKVHYDVHKSDPDLISLTVVMTPNMGVEETQGMTFDRKTGAQRQLSYYYNQQQLANRSENSLQYLYDVDPAKQKTLPDTYYVDQDGSIIGVYHAGSVLDKNEGEIEVNLSAALPDNPAGTPSVTAPVTAAAATEKTVEKTASQAAAETAATKKAAEEKAAAEKAAAEKAAKEAAKKAAAEKAAAEKAAKEAAAKKTAAEKAAAEKKAAAKTTVAAAKTTDKETAKTAAGAARTAVKAAPALDEVKPAPAAQTPAPAAKPAAQPAAPAPAPAPAAPAEPAFQAPVLTGNQGYVTGTDVRFREGASLDANVLGYFTKGEVVYIKGKAQGSGLTWYQVARGDGTNGYIASEYCQPAEGAQIPEVSAGNTGSAASSSASTKAVITGTDVRIRGGASTSADILGYYTKGEEVTIMEVGDGDGMKWYKVKRSDGSIGWVAAQYCQQN